MMVIVGVWRMGCFHGRSVVQAHIGAGYPAGSFNSPRESFVKRKRLYQQGFRRNVRVFSKSEGSTRILTDCQRIGNVGSRNGSRFRCVYIDRQRARGLTCKRSGMRQQSIQTWPVKSWAAMLLLVVAVLALPATVLAQDEQD